MRVMVLDIGGTAIKAGICEDGGLSEIREFPTQAHLGGAQVMKNASRIIGEYRSACKFDRIGISTAGQVDPAAGRIIYANQNIPGYTGMPVKEMLEAEFHVPVSVENDVNAAAIGEAMFGAGKECADFACLTYGTGVGGAIFARGGIYGGSSCSAGEFGAIVVHPEARRPEKDLFSGCYEKYASATALVERVRDIDPSLCNGRLIFAQLDRPDIRGVVDAWIMEIVFGLVTVIHMLNPARVVLGGGVLEQPYVLSKVKEKLYENIMPSFRGVDVRKAELGNRAGMLGAAVLHEMRS